MAHRVNEALIPAVPDVVKRAVDDAYTADRRLQEIVGNPVSDEVRVLAIADFALSELTAGKELHPHKRHISRFICLELAKRQ